MLKEIDKYLLPNDNVLETITNHRQKEFEELEALEKEICKNRQRIREFVENFRLPKFKYPGIDEYLRGTISKTDCDEKSGDCGKSPVTTVLKPLFERIRAAGEAKRYCYF